MATLTFLQNLLKTTIMNVKIITLSIAITLSCVFLSNQTTFPAQSKPKVAAEPIPLSPTSTTSHKSFRPKDRLQSKLPYGSSDRVIIGTDDRVPVLTRAYPWSAIGRIEATKADGSSYTCTGTLIGTDIVLTNAHCLVDETTHQPIIEKNQSPSSPTQIVFQPSMVKGVALDSARVIDYCYGTKKPLKFLGDDWAILKLDRPLGIIYGSLGWQNLDFSNPRIWQATRDRLNLVGYAADFPTQSNSEYGQGGDTAGMNAGCSIEGIETKGTFKGVLLHRCDTNPGASGGPLFAQFSDGNYYIVGLHSGSSALRESTRLSNGEASSVINRGVAVSRWANSTSLMK
jgi:protease YdgD